MERLRALPVACAFRFQDLFDNGTYGTIRMHQEREYPARMIANRLTYPDFARFCEAFGGFGALIFVRGAA